MTHTPQRTPRSRLPLAISATNLRNTVNPRRCTTQIGNVAELPRLGAPKSPTPTPALPPPSHRRTSPRVICTVPPPSRAHAHAAQTKNPRELGTPGGPCLRSEFGLCPQPRPT